MSNTVTIRTTPAHVQVLQAYQRAHETIMASLVKPLFFIVGCQKSGTTWVKAVLDGHPQICCRGEAVFGPVLMPTLKQLVGVYNQQIHDRNDQLGDMDPGLLMTDNQVDFLYMSAVGMMLASWAGSTQAKVLGEKTPEHAVYLTLLNRFFPHAKVVHIIRDGRDVAVSGWFHNLRYAGDKFRARFPDMPSYIRYIVSQHWLSYVQTARAFGQAFPDRYLEFRYEDMKVDPQPIVERVLRFLDVDADEAMVQRCVQAGAFETMSKGRSAGQENRGSFFRKGVTGDWKNHFDEAATAAFMEEGGALLSALGYAT